MFNKDLAEKLIGKEVTIIHKSSFKDSFEEVKGLVRDIEPRVVSLEYKKDRQGGFLFSGMSRAIYQIKDLRGNILYRNDSVPREYSEGKLVDNELSREGIRDKGVFFN